jgi:hypothetical protein
MTDRIAFQDDVYFKGNHCWGCGNENPHVLYILRVKNVHEVKYLAYEFPLHGRGTKYRSAILDY